MRQTRRAATTSALHEPPISTTVVAKKQQLDVLPNEFIVQARVQTQRLMPVWLAKARWLVLRGSKSPILAVYRQIRSDIASCSSNVVPILNDEPLRIMLLSTDTTVQVVGEKALVLTSSRVRRHDTWTIAFASSAQRQRMVELVQRWIELSAFLQRLTDVECVVKTDNSVVYQCREVLTGVGDRGQTAHSSRVRHNSSTAESSITTSGSTLPVSVSTTSTVSRQFALKKMNATKCAAELAMTQRAVAIESLQPYLAQYLFAYTTQQHDASVTLVMPLYHGGSLDDRIRAIGPLDEAVIKCVVTSLCCALYVLHQHGILHLDVKAANILFDSDSPRTFTNLKLVDFGSSALLRQKSQHTAMGTYGCMAPERFDGEAGPPADVYGAGIVLFHMVVGVGPFGGTDPYQILVKNMHGAVRFDSAQWHRVTPSLRLLTERMLDIDPRTRITIPEILKLSWLFQNQSTYELERPSAHLTKSATAVRASLATGSGRAMAKTASTDSKRSCGASTSYYCQDDISDSFAHLLPQQSAKYA